MRGKKEIKPSRRRSEVAKSKPKSPEVVKVKWRGGLIGGRGTSPLWKMGGTSPSLENWKDLFHGKIRAQLYRGITSNSFYLIYKNISLRRHRSLLICGSFITFRDNLKVGRGTTFATPTL